MANVHLVAAVASPHGSGATAKAVEAVLAGAVAAGATSESFHVSTEPVETIVAAIERAQGIVFASPVYRASHTALMTHLLENIERGGRGEQTAPLQGKAAAIVMTGASDHHFLAPERLRGTLSSFFATQVLSPALYVTRNEYTEDKQLGPESWERAHLIGQALVDLTRAVQTSTALRALIPPI